MYTDSQVVLGYLRNAERRFEKYVERRVSLILDHTQVQDWKFIRTDKNPADFATRPCTLQQLKESVWFSGPPFLFDEFCKSDILAEPLELKELPGEKRGKLVLRTQVKHAHFLDDVVSRVSSWPRLLGIARIFMRVLWLVDCARQRKGNQLAPRTDQPSKEDSIIFLVRYAQMEFCQESIALQAVHSLGCARHNYVQVEKT